MLIGAFHYARPSSGSGDAAAEADHFVNVAQFHSGDLVPVLDLETTGGLSASALISWTNAFLDRVYSRTGIRCAIYVSPNFWTNDLANTQSVALRGYSMLWVAHWTTAAAPMVPANNWAGYGWTVWQYSSKGSVPGVPTAVDLDRFNGTDLSKIQIP
jgi:lysozyme